MPEQQYDKKNTKKLKLTWRVIIEVGFIIFLFYSNLLMGEFESSGLGKSKGLLWSIQDIFTMSNFMIAVTSAIIGHLVFDFFRNRL